MVGRERELALLRSTFARTVGDQACQLFTVLGVGGVGKSRLMAAFVDELGERAAILRGRCLPYGEGITFYPLAEALIELADLHEADTPEAARAELAVLAGSGENAGRIAELVGHAIGIAGSETAPEETFWAFRTLMEHLASIGRSSSRSTICSGPSRSSWSSSSTSPTSRGTPRSCSHARRVPSSSTNTRGGPAGS